MSFGGSGPSPGRAAFVHALLLLLAGGTFLEVVTDERHWPFSKYPMYSDLGRASFHRPVVYGVGADGREFPLLTRAELHPLSASQVRESIRRLHRGPNPEADVRRALLDMGRRYEETRRSGAHDGPPLAALRVYECFWDTTDDEAPGPPDRRELRYERTLPADGA